MSLKNKKIYVYKTFSAVLCHCDFEAIFRNSKETFRLVPFSSNYTDLERSTVKKWFWIKKQLKIKLSSSTSAGMRMIFSTWRQWNFLKITAYSRFFWILLFLEIESNRSKSNLTGCPLCCFVISRANVKRDRPYGMLVAQMKRIV